MNIRKQIKSDSSWKKLITSREHVDLSQLTAFLMEYYLFFDGEKGDFYIFFPSEEEDKSLTCTEIYINTLSVPVGISTEYDEILQQLVFDTCL